MAVRCGYPPSTRGDAELSRSNAQYLPKVQADASGAELLQGDISEHHPRPAGKIALPLIREVYL
jgi:hypothetical protein